jgi:hypothetical protein
VSEGCRDARGDVGVPRMCSAKLERCDEAGLGLEPSLSAVGGVRPIEDTELFKEVSLMSTASVLSWSAMATMGVFWGMRGSTQGVYRDAWVGMRLCAFDSGILPIALP